MRIPIGKLASLERGEFEGVHRAPLSSHAFGTAPVAVAQVGDCVFAFDSQCPHRAADLTIFGQIVGDRSLRCGVHGHVYSLETGSCTDGRDCDPRLEKLNVFATEEDRGTLWILVPDDV